METQFVTKIGNIPVFTREGAVEAYKAFARECYADMSVESSQVLFAVGVKMVKLGFTWDELDEFDLEILKEV